jgi:hypothetical protein
MYSNPLLLAKGILASISISTVCALLPSSGLLACAALPSAVMVTGQGDGSSVFTPGQGDGSSVFVLSPATAEIATPVFSEYSLQKAEISSMENPSITASE